MTWKDNEDIYGITLGSCYSDKLRNHFHYNSHEEAIKALDNPECFEAIFSSLIVKCNGKYYILGKEYFKSLLED